MRGKAVEQGDPPGNLVFTVTGPIKGDDDADVLAVAPPTGTPATDVASIEAAVAAATPGSVIQFAAGTYAIEATTQIVVSVPGVTLRGDDDDGTTILGVSQPSDFLQGHFLLDGGHQTVRDLNFDGFGTALTIGAPGTPLGGNRVEDCTFRQGNAGLEFVGFSDDVTRIEDNKFINLTVAFVIFGKTVHFVENTITAPDPASTVFGQPFFTGAIVPEVFSGINISENNVIKKNTVTGIADGFIMFGVFPGTLSRNNVIRENTFRDQLIFSGGDNATIVWLISDGGTMEENFIKKNKLRGSEGIGIVLEGASGNHIVDNKFQDLPGEKIPFSAAFGALPGTGVFLNELTSLNHVKDNDFDDVLNPIVDLGTDNDIDDNEVEDNRFRGPFTARAAGTGNLVAAAPPQQNPKINFLQRWRQRAR